MGVTISPTKIHCQFNAHQRNPVTIKVIIANSVITRRAIFSLNSACTFALLIVVSSPMVSFFDYDTKVRQKIDNTKLIYQIIYPLGNPRHPIPYFVHRMNYVLFHIHILGHNHHHHNHQPSPLLKNHQTSPELFPTH